MVPTPAPSRSWCRGALAVDSAVVCRTGRLRDSGSDRPDSADRLDLADPAVRRRGWAAPALRACRGSIPHSRRLVLGLLADLVGQSDRAHPRAAPADGEVALPAAEWARAAGSVGGLAAGLAGAQAAVGAAEVDLAAEPEAAGVADREVEHQAASVGCHPTSLPNSVPDWRR